MSKQSVLLFAVGSFNPPTVMHLRIMELARDFLTKSGKFQVIGGVLSPVHDAYGKKDLAPAKHRVEMLRLALNLKTDPWLKISDWESLQNNGWSRTRTVLDYHQERVNDYLYGNLSEKDPWMPDTLSKASESVSNVTFKMVCGADVLETFNIPNLWLAEDTLTLAKDYGLLVISRDGNDPYKSMYTCDILYDNRTNIHVVQEWIANEISSTKIRRAVKRQESIRFLVPDEVIDYIKKEGLYL